MPPTTTVTIREARTHLSRLLRRVQAGERILITKRGRPVAMLTPYAPKRRPLGIDVGKGFVHDDWDDPIPEFEEYF